MLQQQSPVQTCAHHWMIQPAISPTSMGMCRFCLELREFKDSPDNTWVIRKRATAQAEDLNGQ